MKSPDQPALADLAERYLRERLGPELGLRHRVVMRQRTDRMTFLFDSTSGPVVTKIFSIEEATVPLRYLDLIPLIAPVDPPHLIHRDVEIATLTEYGVRSMTWAWIEHSRMDFDITDLRTKFIEKLAALHAQTRPPAACQPDTWWYPKPGSRRAEIDRREFEAGLPPGDQLMWTAASYFEEAQQSLNLFRDALKWRERRRLDRIESALARGIERVYELTPSLCLQHGDPTAANALVDLNGDVHLIDFDMTAFAPLPFELAYAAIIMDGHHFWGRETDRRGKPLWHTESSRFEKEYFDLCGNDALDLWKEFRQLAITVAAIDVAHRRIDRMHKRAARDPSYKQKIPHKTRKRWLRVERVLPPM